MNKVCAKMVPTNLSEDQKDNRNNICSDILQMINEQPNLLKNVITCNETWTFQYDPETKRQSMHWKTPTSTRIKKARISRSKLKVMLFIYSL